MSKNNLSNGESPNRTALTVLFSVVFLDNLGFAIVLPYLYFYVQSLGGTTFMYGLLLASYSLMSFIFTPIMARFSDNLGRRKILLAALFISGSSYLIFGVANALWLVFLARMLAGSTAATVPVAQAYVADITSEKQRLKYLGLLGAVAGIAFIVGPAVGGTLSAFFGYAVPSFIASAFAFINLASAYFRLPEPLQARGDMGARAFTLKNLIKVIRIRAISLLFVIYFLFFSAFIFLQSVLPPWLQNGFGWGSLETGFLFFYFGGIIALTQAVILPKLSKKKSSLNLAIYGTVILSAGTLAIGLFTDLPLLFILTGITALGTGIILVTLTTLISLNAPKEGQGGTLGIAQSLAALSQTISPTVATAAFAAGLSWGFTGLSFIISAALAASTLPLIINLKRLSNNDSEQRKKE